MDSKRRLRKADMEFLTHACVYKSSGGDLTKGKGFAEYLKESGFFEGDVDTILRTISVYKSKISKRQWIIGGRGVFDLQGLDYSNNVNLEYNLSFRYVE